MLIGYIRPYYDDPKFELERQLETLKRARCDKLILEEHASAKQRTQLESALSTLKRGDKIVVAKLYILADSTRHLVELLDELEKKGAFLQSIHESIDTSDLTGFSFHTIVKHLVEFQSDVVSERTKKGMLQAKERGAVAGRPRKPDKNVQRAIRMYQSRQYTLAEIREETGISKSTLYRYLEN